jgi:2-oxoisovalerate dehydrogenase E1 component alpha subunit
LIGLGEWSQQRHVAQEEELKAHVMVSWQEAIKYGSLNDGPKPDPATMFEDVYKEIPAHLARQREQWRKEQG